jgi:hypothetical protein
MSAYLKLQTAAREINDVQREVINFNKLFDKKLKAINLFKVDLMNSRETRNALQELKDKANDLIRILDGLFSGGMRSYGGHNERDNYFHGRYGQLKGEAERVKDHLKILRNHTDILINSASETKAEAVVLVAAQEAIDVSDKNDAFGVATEAVGLAIIVTVMIKKLIERIR